MVHFTYAPVEEVAPSKKQRQPSQRTRIQQEYQSALRTALLERDQALVVELEPEDKPLTVRNRLRRAANVLGLDDVTIRRRKNRILVYQNEGQAAAS